MRMRQKKFASSVAAGLMVLSLGTSAIAGTNPCNPCAPKKKMQHNHDMKNPCASKNPCAAKNPCSTKNPCAARSPCAAKNPCAAKRY
ncbi:MAG: hypothetical protein DYH15_04455 [Nitrosomonas sp. PRO4]|nr:hypothetical protein [Nitrosomonas sp. PRO4]